MTSHDGTRGLRPWLRTSAPPGLQHGIPPPVPEGRQSVARGVSPWIVRAVLVAFASLAIVGPASAQIDAEAKTPYVWRVVLKTEAHPLLSSAFREQVRRDLMAALQPALGPLGTVEVIDL